MAEGVEVVGHLRLHSEVLPEEGAADEDVAGDGLAGGQVGVGLQEPAAGDHPAAVGHMLPDAGEELGAKVAGPLVEHGLVVVEDEVGVFVQQVGGGLEGGQGLAQALGPVPDPHRVDMGLAYDVNG